MSSDCPKHLSIRMQQMETTPGPGGHRSAAGARCNSSSPDAIIQSPNQQVCKWSITCKRKTRDLRALESPEVLPTAAPILFPSCRQEEC